MSFKTFFFAKQHNSFGKEISLCGGLYKKNQAKIPQKIFKKISEKMRVIQIFFAF